MAASTYLAQVQQLYIAYFGRPADPIGQAYWAGIIDAAGGSIAAVQAGFSASAESQALYGNKSTIDKVTAIYQNVFNRSPDAAGLTYWVNQIESGKVTQAQASWTIQQNAGAGDAATVQNKLTAAQAFTANVDTAAEISGYQGTAAAASARAFLATVTSDNATATTAVAGAQAAVTAAAVGVSGTAFTLTTGADNFTGTSNNDTFNAVVDGTTATLSTLTAADKIAGGAGVDTLLVTTTNGAVANVLNGADVSGIEVLSVRNTNAAGAGNAATVVNAAGLTAVTAVRGSGDVTVTAGLAQGASLGIDGTTGGVITATYAATANTATLTATNAATAGGFVVNGTGLTTANISSSVGSSTLGGVALGGAVTAVTVDAGANLNTGSITGVAANTTITVKGAGAVNVGTLAANVTTLNASANVGGVTATLSAATTVAVVGSTGNDVITTGAVLAAGSSVDAGAGTADRLVIANTAHLTAATAALYKGFEQLQVADGATADVSLLAANNTIGTIVIADGAGATGVTGLTAAQAANVQITSAAAGVGSAITIGLTGASTAGQIDTVKAALTTTTTAGVANNLDLSGITLTGVEKLELTGNGTVAGTTGTVTLNTAGAVSLDSIILKNAGVNSITISATHTASNLSVDASGSTGNTTIDASAYNTTTGASLKGGSGNDVLVGSAKADLLVGGAGNDILSNQGATVAGGVITGGIVASTAADVFTGGAGNDSFALGVSTVANASTITDLNLGTNTVAGAVDGLWFSVPTPATAAVVVALTTAQQAAVTAAADLATAVNLVLAAASAENNVVQFTFGTDTYIVANGAATATYDATKDHLIKVTGVTGVLDASDIHQVAV